MKTITKALATLAIITMVTPIAMADATKCAHRVASVSNDLFRDTNPKATKVANTNTKVRTKAAQGKR